MEDNSLYMVNKSVVPVADKGSGVKLKVNDIEGGIDEIVIEDSCGGTCDNDQINLVNHTTNDSQIAIDCRYTSPMKTIETTHTVVASNQITVVTHIEPPKVGMVFKSWQEVEAYYKDYAEQTGFGVSRVQGVNSKTDKKIRIGTRWRCECWGRPDMRAIREAKKRAKAMDVCGSGGVVGGVVGEDELRRGKRTSKKCECQAMVYASVNAEGNWILRKVQLEHNHDATPRKAKLVKEYRMKHMTSNVRNKLLNYFDEGVFVSQIHGCMATEMNGIDNMPLTVKDLQHEVYKARRLKMVGGDSVAMFEYFEKMQSGNQNFYYSQRLDDHGRLKDVLWVDARSRAAYEDFGDVVCFDATYLTNEYELQFVNFVGVNHHGESMLLGCALVSHEDCDTFRWIFGQWLAAMNNRPPQAILTDQAAAMRKPLEEIMPLTRHRWCIWHIMSKIPEKLGKCSKYDEFKNILKAIVYESFTTEEFHARWAAFLTEYKLEGNDWLESLHKESHMWVPAYMKEFFWAGMKTTQRVESINRFFDGFVNRHTKLFEFPQKYCKALEKRVRDEVNADARCAKYLRRLVSGFKVEKLFQKIYTDTKFQEVQKECSRMMYCFVREENVVSEDVTQYMLEGRVWIILPGNSEEILTDRRRFFCVLFNSKTREVTCDCRKFKTHGILCKHTIRVLDQNFVFDIPDKYILDRWRKDIPRKHTRVKVAYHDPCDSTQVQRFNKMMNVFEPLCDAASMVNDETVTFVIDTLTRLRSDVDECTRLKKEQTVALSLSYDGENGTGNSTSRAVSLSSVLQPRAPETSSAATKVKDLQVDALAVKDPPIKKKPCGRPKGSRHKPMAEIGYKKPNTKKKTQAELIAVHEATNAKLQVVRHDDINGLDCGDELLIRNSMEWGSNPSTTF